METNKPVVPFRFYSPLKCPKCGKLSLELYDIKNRPIGLRKMLDLEASGVKMNIDMSILSYFRCELCDSGFMLSWDVNGSRYPRPLRDRYSMDAFLLDTYNTTIE